LTKRFEIDRSLNGAPAKPASGLWLEDRGVRVPRSAVQATPRIGVNYAGPIWKEKPWRFVISDLDVDKVTRAATDAARTK